MRRHRNNSALKMQNVLLNSSKYGRSASNTPPYALHGLLLAICARRAGIPSKTDHRVRKLTYTHTPCCSRDGRGASQGEYERGSVIAAICMIGYIENVHDFVSASWKSLPRVASLSKLFLQF